MKVLIITYYWPPSGGAGVQRCLKFVKHLPEFGIEPTVITVKADKASYPVTDTSLLRDVPADLRVIRTSTTEPFEYYKKLTGKKDIPIGGFANDKKEGLVQKLFKFLRGNLFIPDARVGWNGHAYKAAKKLLKSEQFDAVITSSPPHSTQLIGLKLKKQFPHIKWIADMRDPWTDVFYYSELSHTALAKKLDSSYEKQVLENADQVAVVSNDMKRLFVNKSTELDPDKIHVIPNGYDEADFVYDSVPSKFELIITYTGTITSVYNIGVFLKALKHMQELFPQIKYKLRFVGKTAPDIQRQIENVDLQDITEFVPYVPHEESIRYMMQTTVLLMAIPDVPNNFGIVTGKLFEYLASNKPIICIGPLYSDVDRIIDECGAGRVFHYAAYDLMVDHLKQLSNNWLINPNLDLPFINYSQYSRRALTKTLADLIQEK